MRTFGLAVLYTAGALFGQTPPAKRVAIFDFENTGSQGVTSPFFQTAAPNFGKAVADLLVNRLVKNASVVVIERSALDKVLGEQNLSNSDRTNAATAAKIGRILGVDAIILGSITKNDFPVVQAVVLVLAVIYVGLTMLADILNAVLDPRIRSA